MQNFDEEQFRSLAKEEMLLCRPGDWEHAKRVIKWVKELLGQGRKDLPILIKAAYIHDIGWRDVLPRDTDKISKETLLKFEPRANENTESYVSTFLKRFSTTDAEIKKALRLISATDEHHANSEAESIIVDADSLSKMDINHVRQKYKPEDWLSIHKLWENEFLKRFKTKKGKELYPSLLKQLKKEIVSELNS